MSEFYTFGQVAEQKEVNYLKEMNYIVLEQNYRYRKAEIDIIAQKNNLTLQVRSDIITYLVENETWTRDHFNDAFYPF